MAEGDPNKSGGIQLPPEVQTELQVFEEDIQKFKKGSLNPDEFKKRRLRNGIYGIRFEPTLHMVRIKCPYGTINADQLDQLADLTEQFTPEKQGHITTRQAIQLHRVKLDHVMPILRSLNGCGLTTREACGNTVRNVTTSPYSGLVANEVFDVTPYADVVFRRYLRHPLTQDLPRKFKFALFGGGTKDIAYTAMHDVGLVAAKRVVNGKEQKGFQVYLGGGLGAVPHAAILLEEFTSVDDLLATTDAAIRIFDRHGNRQDKLHARLKYVVSRFGPEEFRKLIIAERAKIQSEGGGKFDFSSIIESPVNPPKLDAIEMPTSLPAEFQRWKGTNVLPQKHKGYCLVTVVIPLGDIHHKQMRELAAIARTFNGGALRTTVQQNFVLPWIKEEHLEPLYARIHQAGLDTGGALRFVDVTRCPGSDTCQLAITKSRGLAAALNEAFQGPLKDVRDLDDLTIKVSGCTNSCGHHHIGNIGCYGTYRKINGREVPHYQVLIGGHIDVGEAKFGQPVGVFPARRVPDAVNHLVRVFQKEKQGEETFVQTMRRLDRKRLSDEVKPFTSVPPYEENPAMYSDWLEDKDFHAEVGVGECAS